MKHARSAKRRCHLVSYEKLSVSRFFRTRSISMLSTMLFISTVHVRGFILLSSVSFSLPARRAATEAPVFPLLPRPTFDGLACPDEI